MTTRERRAAPALDLYLLLVALCLLACPHAFAADIPVNPQTIPLASDYDLSSTSYIYCYTTGIAGNIRGDWRPVALKIATSGSSTTTTSVSSNAAFTGISVGDELMLYQSGRPVRRYVTAVASVNSITVNSAWTIPAAGTTFFYRPRTCSTAATAGWFRVAELGSFSIEVKIATFNAAAIDTIVQCRADDAAGETNTAYTQQYTSTAGDTYVFAPQLGPIGDECRVGMKITTDGGTNAVTLNLMTR